LVQDRVNEDLTADIAETEVREEKTANEAVIGCKEHRG
jgi:hypothetical protein